MTVIKIQIKCFRYLLFIVLMSVTSLAWADTIVCSQLSLGDCANVFQPVFGDQSVTYLGELFGSVGSLVGIDNSILAHLLGLFNAAIWTVISVLVGYTVIISAIKSGQEGNVMNRTVSVWALLRSIAGVAVLLPLKGGYSAIQILVMLVVLKGVWLADSLWSKTIDLFGGLGGSVATTVLPGLQSRTAKYDWLLAGLDNSAELTEQFKTQAGIDLNVASNIINQLVKSQICMYRLQITFDVARKRAKNAGITIAPQTFSMQYGEAGALKNTVYFGGYSKDHESAYYRGRCGIYKLGSTIPQNRETFTSQSKDVLPSMVQKSNQPTVNAAINYQRGAIGVATSQTAEEAKRIAKDNTINDGEALVADMTKALRSYLTITRVAALVLNTTLSSESYSLLNPAKRQGWMMAPRYYLALVNGGKRKPGGINLTNLEISYAQMDTSHISKNIPSYPFNFLKDVNRDSAYKAENRNSIPPMFSSAELVSSFSTASQEAKQNLVDSKTRFEKLSETTSNSESPFEPVSYKIGRFKPITLINYPHFNDWGGGGISGDITDLFDDIYDAFIDLFNMQLTNLERNPIYYLQKMGATMMATSLDFWITGGKHLFKSLRKKAWKYFGISFGLEVVEHVFGLISFILLSLAKALWFVPGLPAILRALAMVFGGGSGLLDGFAQMQPLIFSIEIIQMLFYLPLALAISVPVFVMGMTLGIYMPFIPILLFSFAALGWLLSVAESMVSAPLIALGIAHPEGHDFLGRSEQAMILLLGVFIRPASMILGLVFSTMLIFIGVKLLSFGFIYFIMHTLESQAQLMQNFISSDVAKFLLFICYILVFIWSMLSVINYCCNVIYDDLGGRLIRWLGAPRDRSIIKRLMAKAKGQFRRGMQGAEGAGETMRGKQHALSPEMVNVWRGAGSSTKEELARRGMRPQGERRQRE